MNTLLTHVQSLLNSLAPGVQQSNDLSSFCQEKYGDSCSENLKKIMTTCGHITKQIDSKELEEPTSKNKAYELKIKNGQEALDKLIKEKDAKFEE